jgi:hypothetical protein
MVERDDIWLLPVASQQVTRVYADYAAVRLLCANAMEIYIGEPFTSILISLPGGGLG